MSLDRKVDSAVRERRRQDKLRRRRRRTQGERPGERDAAGLLTGPWRVLSDRPRRRTARRRSRDARRLRRQGRL